MFVTNDASLKVIRKLKGTDGQYLWQPSVKDGVPDTILGKPIFTPSYVPVMAAEAKTVAFGDFSYYWIADRRETRFKVLNELYAETDHIGFRQGFSFGMRTIRDRIDITNTQYERWSICLR